jgi:hypothetical protein
MNWPHQGANVVVYVDNHVGVQESFTNVDANSVAWKMLFFAIR